MISWAMRESVRESASASSRDFPDASTALTAQRRRGRGRAWSFDSFPASLGRVKGVRGVTHSIPSAPDGRESARTLCGSDRLGRRQRAARPGGRGRGAARGAAARAALARAAYERGARYVERPYFEPERQADPRRAGAGRHRSTGCRRGSGSGSLGLGELNAARVVLVPLVPPGLLDGVDPARAGRDRLPTVKERFKIDRRPLDRVDALAVPDAAVGEDRLPGRSRRRGARAALAGHRPRLPARRARSRPARGTSASSRSGRWRAGSTRSTSTRCTSPGRAPISRSACCRARASRRRAARRTRAPASATSPNLPTEEVFTTPDPERTSGLVTATKPLDVAGSLVTGLRVRFEGGRAVADRRRHERGDAARALRGRRRCVTARRGRARRPREPHRQARPDVLQHAARRERREPPRARRRLLRADRRSRRPAAHQRERGAHRLHDRLGRGRGHRHDEGGRDGARSCAAAPGRSRGRSD